MEMTKPAERRVFRLAVTPLRDVVVRDATGTGDGSWTMEGYAAVFDQETVLYDGRWIRIRERIAHGSFDGVLQQVAAGNELVHFNFGHDMNTAIAATNVTGIGGLELDVDFHGLRFFARVDPDDPDAVRLAAKMRRKVVGQASFAFTIGAEHLVESTIGDDGVEDDLWEIDEVNHLYDVCACPQGAYAQTESHLRSLAAASLGRSGFEPEGLDRRVGVSEEAPTGDTDIAPEQPEPEAATEATAGAGDPTRTRQLAQLRAKATVLAHHHPKEQQ
jgi:HK97 family phage prohead protease